MIIFVIIKPILRQHALRLFQLTPQSSVLRDQLITAQPFKKFPVSHVIHTYINVFTKVAFWFPSWSYDTKFFMVVYIHTVVISSVTTYNYLPKYAVSKPDDEW